MRRLRLVLDDNAIESRLFLYWYGNNEKSGARSIFDRMRGGFFFKKKKNYVLSVGLSSDIGHADISSYGFSSMHRDPFVTSWLAAAVIFKVPVLTLKPISIHLHIISPPPSLYWIIISDESVG